MLAFVMFDPLYFIVLAPAMLLALWAQAKVKSAYARAGEIPVSSRQTGAQAARRILDGNGLTDVEIEPSRGLLSDHYDPRHRVLRLSPDVYQGRSLASVGIAAHEAGHAIQHAAQYGPLALRNGLVPLASTGSSLAIFIFIIGSVLSAIPLGQTLMVAAIFMFAAVVIFQLVNLPIEYNASTRAMAALTESGIITVQERAPVQKVLSAAAMTYVAATLSAILTLLYLLLRSGLLGGRRG
ncbi:MAG: zinc metallopeptidase [Phycisphaerales bacterium]|nr:MAG: zinc metallopeptidase [Phycisphaerales bacterium]